MGSLVVKTLPFGLLLTNQLEPSPSGGRALLCKLNHDVLVKTYGDRLQVLELSKHPISGIKSIVKTFFGNIDGVNDDSIAASLGLIISKDIGKVFVDGSNLGGLVKAVKQNLPHVEVITFFHNVEARFFWGAFRQDMALRSLAVLIVNYLTEKKSVRFSDKLICLSSRDSSLLHKLYGRPATHLSPIALHDKLPKGMPSTLGETRPKYTLFVGGDFYANRAGITWFVKNVVPRINIKTCIVGKGLEDLKNVLEVEGRVEVIGAVDCLADWYQKAHFVIAPIFDGSGMKTKVAEALMFGKRIIGTAEAFSGYEDIATKVGVVCSTADEFVSAIQSATNEVLQMFDPELRKIYEDDYSFIAASSRLSEILAADK
jgi:glycosyltransferase involved in cell wall biosynthesis